MPAATDVQPFPAGFLIQDIRTNGTTLHLRVGGQGPAAPLLHGYAETGDMWAPLATELARDHHRCRTRPTRDGTFRLPRTWVQTQGHKDTRTQGQDIAGHPEDKARRPRHP